MKKILLAIAIIFILSGSLFVSYKYSSRSIETSNEEIKDSLEITVLSGSTLITQAMRLHFKNSKWRINYCRWWK